MSQDARTTEVFTVGHSNVELDGLVSLLRLHDVRVLADVRSAPYSRYVPQFNREVLETVLAREGIQYVFMGGVLGGRPSGSTDEAPVRPDYDEMAEADEFKQGIADLIGLARQDRVCVLCSEEDPGRCHRGLLIGRVLAECGVAVRHIRGDGSLEAQEQMTFRMAKGQLSLFPG